MGKSSRVEAAHSKMLDGDLFTYSFAAESNTGVRGVRFSSANGARQVQVENLTDASNVFVEER